MVVEKKSRTVLGSRKIFTCAEIEAKSLKKTAIKSPSKLYPTANELDNEYLNFYLLKNVNFISLFCFPGAHSSGAGKMASVSQFGIYYYTFISFLYL